MPRAAVLAIVRVAVPAPVKRRASRKTLIRPSLQAVACQMGSVLQSIATALHGVAPPPRSSHPSERGLLPSTAPPVPAASPPPPPRAGRFSYQSKLILGVCSLVLCTGGGITWLAHRSARATTDRMAATLFRETSAHAVT